MFFLIWGHKQVMRLFGPPELMHCDTCEKERSFRLGAFYESHHLMWLFRWVRHVRYRMRCEVCGRGEIVNASEVPPEAKKKLVPFMDRYGWLVGLAVVGVLVLLLAIAIINDEKQDAAYLAAPLAGDTYEAEISKFEKAPSMEERYVLMRVQQVLPDRVVVQISTVYCTRFGCAQRAYDEGKAKEPGFYGPELYEFPRTDLPAMRKDGRITYVNR